MKKRNRVPLTKIQRRNMDILVDQLHRWALYRLEPVVGLSYPSKSVEAKAMEYGCSISGNQKHMVSYWPSKSESTLDQIIAQLPPRQRAYIFAAYVENQKPNVISSRFGVTLRQVSRLSKLSHQFIANKINLDIG